MPYKFNPVTGKLDYYEAGSGSANLATVLANGNASGAHDINFDTTQGLYFNNSSRLREGTIDALLGGSKGIAQICAVGYELKWEAGRQYVMDGNGIYIRHSLYNFTITPTVNDDLSLGYLTGSRWSLDDGTTYVCIDPTTGAAVWELEIEQVATIVKTKVVNKTTPSVTLTKANYQACVVAGATGQRLSVRLAKADSDANSAGTLGIASQTIPINQEGYITSIGAIVDINTTGSLQGETWADGDLLFLSPTVAGGITNIKPTAPNHLIVIGYVEYAHAVHGKIYAKIDNGYELDELHNVKIDSGTLANNNILAYTLATQVWENKTLASVLGFTPAVSEGWNVIVKSANQDVTNNATLVDDTDLQFSVVAGGHYMLELDLVLSTNSTVADYKSGFIVSAGTMKGQGVVINNSTGSVAQVINITAGGASVTNSIGSGTSVNDLDYLLSIKTIYSFTASSNATFKFQFAQNTATPATTARTWKGSILKYKRID